MVVPRDPGLVRAWACGDRDLVSAGIQCREQHGRPQGASFGRDLHHAAFAPAYSRRAGPRSLRLALDGGLGQAQQRVVVDAGASQTDSKVVIRPWASSFRTFTPRWHDALGRPLVTAAGIRARDVAHFHPVPEVGQRLLCPVQERGDVTRARDPHVRGLVGEGRVRGEQRRRSGYVVGGQCPVQVRRCLLDPVRRPSPTRDSPKSAGKLSSGCLSPATGRPRCGWRPSSRSSGKPCRRRS